MDLKRKLIGSVFAVIAASGLLIACGPEEGASCEFDQDCVSGELCFNDRCEPECTVGGSECIGDEVCTPRTGADGSVCIIPGGTNVNNPNNNGAECTTNEECNQTDAGGYCDTDEGICKTTTGPTKEFFTVKVQDATTVAKRCEDKSGTQLSPATKISYIQLLDSNYASLGYADAVGDNIKGDSAFNESFAVFDGSAPDLKTDECVEGFTTDNGVALGCDGYVMVQFKGSNGKAVKLEAGQQILVGVYGQTCNKEYDKLGEDKYNVYLCDTVKTDNTDDKTCLSTPMNSGALNGIKYVDVKL